MTAEAASEKHVQCWDWDLLCIPCCEGSIYLGALASDDAGEGLTVRCRRRLANLTAGLEHAKDLHPSAGRNVVAGAAEGASVR